MKICFVSYNGCIREFMAEYICKKCIKEMEVEDKIYVTSRGVSSTDNRIPVPNYEMWEMLDEYKIPYEKKKPEFIKSKDYKEFDLFVGFDQIDVELMEEAMGEDLEGKYKMILDYTGIPKEIMDPWFTHKYESVVYNIMAGCKAMIRNVLEMEPPLFIDDRK